MSVRSQDVRSIYLARAAECRAAGLYGLADFYRRRSAETR